MAHLWMLDSSAAWAVAALDDEAGPFALGDGLVRRHEADSPVPPVLLRRLAPPLAAWALVCGERSGVRVNGSPVPVGLAVLADRDEIRLPGFTGWFSTELQARIEPFPEAARRGFCPRCKRAIDAGAPAVRCPACGLWHHASDDFPCWTYAPSCGGCPHPTALDAGFRWSPEDL
jgi:hypothetical protein